MNAAHVFPASYEAQAPAEPSASPLLLVPAELRVLLDESPKMRASFERIADRDRRGFVRYINEPMSVMTRERRAAIVGMSLIGLARDMRDDGSLNDAPRLG
ncbi:MAG: hypothetical protein JWP97_720 [Labilithrix sp.]|nr:hypothetical protein [Labilithrix sp.]